MKNSIEIDIDGYDIAICICLIGGFATGQWWPAVVLFILGVWRV